MIAEPTPRCSEPTTESMDRTDTEFTLPSGRDPQQKLPGMDDRIFDCTCREPQGVLLSVDGDDKSTNQKNKSTFIENLQTHGWCPIIVPQAPCPSPSQEEILAIFRRRRQKQQEKKGCPETIENDVTFIASESGSSEGTIEPKESLEVQLSKCVRKNSTLQDKNANDNESKTGDDNGDEIIVKKWCKAMSWIAHKVCSEMLDLPGNAFLPVDPKESLDLLRVFHYFAVSPPAKESAVPPTLGSSEHTDWGSLTVVWQDSVGGLQTYCRKRQKWINVKAATKEEKGRNGPSHRWECIVHVGDMASLVLDTRKAESRSIDNMDTTTNCSTNNNLVSYPWPSPRHRVRSHPNKERVSLVYFGYPPRGLSLGTIQKRLDEGWPHSSTRGRRLPLEEYFLLRNQSVGAAESDQETNASHMYQTMWNLPIQDIVRLKWEQVSRGG